MSINSALSAGVAGLNAYSAGLAVISDNIANVNTVGYKRSTAEFSTLVTDNDLEGKFAAGGVRAGSRSFVSEGGLIQSSSNSTDLAISGDGLFVVRSDVNQNNTEPVLFTRAGAFNEDQEGFLRNSAGFYLQGWPVDAQGEVNSNPSDFSLLQPVNVDQLGGTAEPSTTVNLDAIFNDGTPISAAATGAPATYAPTTPAINMSSGSVAPDFEFSAQVFDSKGGVRTIDLLFLKSATPNQWHAEIRVSPSTDVTSNAASFDSASGQIAVGDVAFNADGTLDLGSTTLPLTLDFLASGSVPGAGQFAWSTGIGVEAQSITLGVGGPNSAAGFKQLNRGSGENSVLLSTVPDGALFGTRSGLEVDEEGFVTAVFTNGVRRQLYQVPLATFVNPDGLTATNGNAYRLTVDSGGATLEEPGSGKSGNISSSALESSTVDLATEFTNLITTQRAYSASTKIITTSDQMLEELIRIKQ
ncbi:MAG: flagellar hook protein FlgE [Pseudomonadota bacterium]